MYLNIALLCLAMNHKLEGIIVQNPVNITAVRVDYASIGFSLVSNENNPMAFFILLALLDKDEMNRFDEMNLLAAEWLKRSILILKAAMIIKSLNDVFPAEYFVINELSEFLDIARIGPLPVGCSYVFTDEAMGLNLFPIETLVAPQQLGVDPVLIG